MQQVKTVTFYAIGDPKEQLDKYGKQGYRIVGIIGVVSIAFNTSNESLNKMSKSHGFPMSLFDTFPFELLKDTRGYVYVNLFIMENVI